MKNFGILLGIVGIIMMMITGFSYATQKRVVDIKTPQYVIDPVCGMKVDKSEAYRYKYQGATYYFDNYNCKQSFKMTPEKFLNNKCVNSKDTIPQK
jgi:YHS domain-containing protein